jgi:L-threonylcarbamoyladenylate synthase
MPTAVWPIDPDFPDPDVLARAANGLRAGKLVVFPTETVYGLGANAFDADAVGRIFAAKGRPSRNPLIVHVPDATRVHAVAGSWPEAAVRLAAAFWPGPLTMVVPKAKAIPDAVSAGGTSVGVRCPAHPVARALLAAAGVPVAAPSANRSGGLSPTTAAHVVASLGDRVDVVLDGGPCHGGLESTVVDLTGPVPRLLRPGLVRVGMLEAIVGRVEVAHTFACGDDDIPLPSPGLLAKHYAPATKLEAAESDGEADQLEAIYRCAGMVVARWRPLGTPEQVAAKLYAELHTLDESGFDRIIATLPPPSDEWRAVRDRLLRAAAE